MPSIQSYIFRVLTKLLSARMNAIESIPKLRAFMEIGPKKPYLPRGTSIITDRINGIPVEWINPSQADTRTIILYLHGGGWTLGWKNNHRMMVAHICQSASSRALAVDYRLAPENPFPAALEDCLAAYRWLINNGTLSQQIVIAGDSAGANLVLATMLSLRDSGDPLPAAAVCISPMIDLSCSGETFFTNKDSLLTPKFALKMAEYYCNGQDPRSPLISPLYGNLEGLPPLLIHVGADEILLSDATRLKENASSAGVDVNLVVWPHMWHVWHTFVPFLPEANQAVKQIGEFIHNNLNADPEK